jgi:hypothetical protein
MNVNAFLQKDYDDEPPSGPKKTNPNKPNSNPISITKGIINCIYEVALIYCIKYSQIFQRS